MTADLIASSPPVPQHELDQLQSAVNFGPDVASPVISGYGPPSVTSDSVSITGLSYSSLPSYMTSIQPKPCYASRESASRAATELYRQHKEMEDAEQDSDLADDTDRVQVSENATAQVNSFLDKVLYDILVLAQSTQLPQLRTAAADVLRRNLGKEAVGYADANLEDLLAVESEDDGDDQVSTPTDSATKWDLESTWKRIRLRVMMRSENSDFDIDDDEHHASLAGLSGLTRRLGDSSAAVISLHSEIFLAGVLDFISDHVFAVAIIPASIRMRRTSKKTPAHLAEPNVLFVEETDLEKGVLNSPLDRLWRAWRKSTRSRASYPTSPRHGYSFSDTSSPETTRRGSTQWGDGPYRSNSQDLMTPRGMPGEYIETPAVELAQREAVPDADYSERILASNIPLPTNANDVDEIETPGLAPDPDDYLNARPRSDRPASAIRISPMADANPRNSLGITMPEERSLAADTNNHIETADQAEPHSKSRGQKTLDHETASALTGGQPLETPRTPDDADMQHPERSSSLSNPVASPTMASKRNREAAVGMGFPNGISLPGDAIPKGFESGTAVNAMVKPPQESSANRESRDDPRLRAASPSSETEGSEIMSPHDFMAARNLQTTRTMRSDSSPLPSAPLASPTKVNGLSPLRTKLQTTGLQINRGEHSPVSPLTASEIGLERPSDSSKYGVATIVSSPVKSGSMNSPAIAPTSVPTSVPTSAPTSTPTTSPASAGRNDPRKASAPAGRLTDDLARARGSPKMRQTSLQDRESLRRIAVERNGSLVSLVDENHHRPRKQTPLTSSSIVTAEDFDSLLNGSDTIKMTLSPSSVREAPSEPASRSGSIDQSAFARMNGSTSDFASILKKKMQAEIPGSPSMKSPSVGSSERTGRGRSGSATTEQGGRSSSRPSVRNKSRTRAGFMAREPTVQTDSTRDFADFIRSTGPNREPQTLVPALTAQRQPSVGGHSQRQPSIDARRQPSISNMSTTSPQRQSSLAGPQISDTAGIKYKRNYAPREARGSEPSGNAGLIDFIRSGPTPAKANIPSKDIAPFRYSPDSDDMRDPIISLDDADGHRASISTMHTMMTYGSHAPLVAGHQSSVSASPLGGSTPRMAAEKDKPKKSNYVTNADGIQRYRNKDPYAIDISDDEEDDDVAYLSPPQKSVSGSANQSSRSGSLSLGPFMSDGNTAYTTDASTDPRSLSSSSRAATSSSGLALNGVSYQPTSPSGTGPRPTAQAPLSPTARSGSMASLATPAATPAAAPQPGRVVIPRNPNRPKPELRPAAARAESSSTRDLADFFKNSGPPPSVGAAPSPNIGGGSSEKLVAGKGEDKEKRKFWQRKRYLDMP